jgi:aspartate racemase
METVKTIGIVGGVGPYAGVDLFNKILDQTKAITDQEHLPLAMLSVPHTIQDRTAFLMGKSNENPAIAIAEVITKLHQCGASVVGIPCNTAHAEPIFSEISRRMPNGVHLLHLINEVALYIRHTYPTLTTIGVLSTTGTFETDLYPAYLEQHGLRVIQVSKTIQQQTIHPAIYHQEYGIKAHTAPVSNKAREKINEGIDYLITHGAEAIILGCTEIPLLFTGEYNGYLPLIDPTHILARALIMAFAPERLLDLKER